MTSPPTTDNAEQTAGAALDLVKTSDPPAHIGANELGRIEISSRAVEKIAAIAAVEVPDAGGAAPRLLGRPIPGAGRLRIRDSSLDSLPKVNADVDGQLAFLDVELSVRWPAPVARVTETVRQHLSRRIGDLVGLDIREVNITVVDLITDRPTVRVS